MKNVWFIMQKELKVYFTSAIAYALGAFFLAVTGYFFSLIIFYSGSTSFGPVFNNIAVILLFVLPLLSMRLIAEERKSGTIEILLTRPIKDWQIVTGKFLAALVLYLVMLAFTAFYLIVVFKYGKVELAVLFSGYLGIFLVGASILSLGVFISALTSNQIIAAVATFALCLILWLISSSSGLTGGNENILSYLSLSSHLDDFVNGTINLKNIIYYLSFIFFWIYLTTRILELRNWRQ